ncbi:hypothetical protein [Aneurinibacillus terranovensis]|uniref:hypothetical protein n=1 Tax=Aneurinibacillus terranovensis TaxID=278991 RepID=UPI00041A3725|nr:hypothetical protein [Aneurinibacillus terranovensis]
MNGQRKAKEGSRIIDFKKKRREKRRKSQAWLRCIQVVLIATSLLFIYKGALLLLHVNVSYLQNSHISSQKLSSVENPEARSFAEKFVADWLGPSAEYTVIQPRLKPSLNANRLKDYRFKKISRINVTQVYSKSQFKGVVDLTVTGELANGPGTLHIGLPLEYLPEKNKFQIYDYPVVIKQ